MSLPPLLLSAAILFWAWQSGLWLLGVAVALLLELPRLSPRRWNFAVKDLKRFCDFCVAVGAGVGLLFYFSYGNPRAVIQLFQWLPFIRKRSIIRVYQTKRDG